MPRGKAPQSCRVIFYKDKSNLPRLPKCVPCLHYTHSGYSTATCPTVGQLYISYIENAQSVCLDSISTSTARLSIEAPALKPHYQSHCFCQGDADNLYTTTAEPSTDTLTDYSLPPKQLWNDGLGQQTPLISSHRRPELCGRRHLARCNPSQVI